MKLAASCKRVVDSRIGAIYAARSVNRRARHVTRAVSLSGLQCLLAQRDAGDESLPHVLPRVLHSSFTLFHYI
ncbi:MAG: hypothetical protein DMG54_31140 [Acidobacteria bacterium]|nr:MAG: hypothetical protein DMG54_31140 [Acidobacteriota bacterium]PYU77422.1 MAG: hypothetical protein DMG52_00390 [Acidobacteriota bacterium]